MIEFNNVSFSRGDTEIFSGISFRLPKGSFTAVAGENGAGKSTLCRLCVSLLKPSSGTVTCGGCDTAKKQPAFFASFTGFLFQNPDRQICRTKVMDEVMFSIKAAGLPAEGAYGRASDLLCRMGLDGGADIFSLSRSARQMTALASVLIKSPDLLILDEPTSGLGYEHRELTKELLLEEKTKGTTVIMVTHDMDLAESAADDMLFIQGPREAIYGTADEVTDMAGDGGHALRVTEMRELGRRLGAPFSSARGPEQMALAVKACASRSVA